MWSIYIEVYRNIILFSKKIVHTTKFHDGDSICVLNRPKYVIAARLKIVLFPPYFNKLLLMQSVNSSLALIPVWSGRVPQMHRLTFHLTLLTEMQFRYAIFRALFIILIDFVRLMSSTCGLILWFASERKYEIFFNYSDRGFFLTQKMQWPSPFLSRLP